MISNVVDSKSERAIEIDPRGLWGGNAKPISIEVHTSSYKSVRGYSIVGAVLDELAFWDTDPFGANSDEETLAAIKAGMRTRVPDGLLVAISSPYSRKGVLWETYDQHFGQENDDVLVVQGASHDFNPTIPEALVNEEIEKDEAKASSEYLGLFRRDIDSFVSKDLLADCLDGRTSERGFVQSIQYSAFVDPAGGSGSDSFTLAIGHSETRKNADRIDVGIAVLDLVQEVRPNFSPETVIAEFCQVLKSYRISKVVGDRYAGSFPSEQFEKRGIRYEPSSLSASEIYREALALFNSRKVRLVRNNRLLSQLASLERRTSRRGDIIDHPAGGHDDLAVACCGVLLEVTGNGQSLSMTALAAGWAQRSDDALLKELPLERQSAVYAYESSQWTDLTFEGRNWSARRR